MWTTSLECAPFPAARNRSLTPCRTLSLSRALLPLAAYSFLFRRLSFTCLPAVAVRALWTRLSFAREGLVLFHDVKNHDRPAPCRSRRERREMDVRHAVKPVGYEVAISDVRHLAALQNRMVAPQHRQPGIVVQGQFLQADALVRRVGKPEQLLRRRIEHID